MGDVLPVHEVESLWEGLVEEEMECRHEVVRDVPIFLCFPPDLEKQLICHGLEETSRVPCPGPVVTTR